MKTYKVMSNTFLLTGGADQCDLATCIDCVMYILKAFLLHYNMSSSSKLAL